MLPIDVKTPHLNHPFSLFHSKPPIFFLSPQVKREKKSQGYRERRVKGLHSLQFFSSSKFYFVYLPSKIQEKTPKKKTQIGDPARNQMGQQKALIYAFVGRGNVILAEYTDFSGNFNSIAYQCLQKLPASNNKFTYNCDGHTFNYLVDNGFSQFSFSIFQFSLLLYK